MKYTLPERESNEAITRSRISFEKMAYMKDLLSTMSYVICILNKSNQIVFFNEEIVEKYGLNIEQDLWGSRPGELLHCVNSRNDTGGCGTTEKCQYCGAFNAFRESWFDKKR